MTFSAKPSVSPEFLAARAKGRLQHAYRQAGRPVTVDEVLNGSLRDYQRPADERFNLL